MTPMPSWVSSTVTALFGRTAVQWATGSTWPVNRLCRSSGGSAKSYTRSTLEAISICFL